jgi:threonine/homoserine/homoserine lactone efflux protein
LRPVICNDYTDKSRDKERDFNFMDSLIPFIFASAILLVIPGPAVIYIVTRSVYQGRLAGIVSVLGIHVGTIIQIMAVAFGLSAVLLTSVVVFNVVKYLGAAYLIYLGIRTFIGKDSAQEIKQTGSERLRRVFYEGIIVNALNPKTALFFFAFLPQFIAPSQGPANFQILILGAIFIAMGLVSDGLYVILAGCLGHWLKQRNLFCGIQRYLAGSVYILLGLVTALSGSKNSK